MNDVRGALIITYASVGVKVAVRDSSIFTA